MLSPLIDSHCHLTSDRFQDDRAGLIERMHQDGLQHALLIGTGIEDGMQALDLAATAPDRLSVSIGLDPFTSHQLADDFPRALKQLADLVAQDTVCAVGEIGLDYHYDLDAPTLQREKFSQQLDLAQQVNKPVVIHVREAHQDMAEVLADFPSVRGVIHSFTAGPAEVESYLALGWYIAFNGVLTFKNAPEVREAARLVPNDRLLIETDSPYLAPIPNRGKRCQPAFIADTARRLAEERGERAEDIALWTARNACQLFGWDPHLAIPL